MQAHVTRLAFELRLCIEFQAKPWFRFRKLPGGATGTFTPPAAALALSKGHSLCGTELLTGANVAIGALQSAGLAVPPGLQTWFELFRQTVCVIVQVLQRLLR